MSYKLDETTKTYRVWYSKRHPVTRVPCRAARKGIKSLAEAKRVYTDLVLQVDSKLKAVVMPTWEQLLSDFEAYGKAAGSRFGRKTIQDMLYTLRAYTAEWNGRFSDSITGIEIQGLIEKATLKGLSTGHQQNILKYIRAVFRYALDRGLVHRDPVPRIKFKKGDKIKGVLTAPQARMLLEKAKNLGWAWYQHIAVALYTGMRNGELYALRWDSVDLDRRVILVNSSWNKVDGFKGTKSEDDRIVEIAPDLVLMLKQMRLESGATSPYVLPRMVRWSMGLQASDLRMFLAALGLPEVRFHDLRATWATIMLSNGVEPAKVMVMGGWKSMKTMMIYMRKAGIDIRGCTDGFSLHNPINNTARVLKMEPRSNS